MTAPDPLRETLDSLIGFARDTLNTVVGLARSAIEGILGLAQTVLGVITDFLRNLNILGP